MTWLHVLYWNALGLDFDVIWVDLDTKCGTAIQRCDCPFCHSFAQKVSQVEREGCRVSWFETWLLERVKIDEIGWHFSGGSLPLGLHSDLNFLWKDDNDAFVPEHRVCKKDYGLSTVMATISSGETWQWLEWTLATEPWREGQREQPHGNVLWGDRGPTGEGPKCWMQLWKVPWVDKAHLNSIKTLFSSPFTCWLSQKWAEWTRGCDLEGPDGITTLCHVTLRHRISCHGSFWHGHFCHLPLALFAFFFFTERPLVFAVTLRSCMSKWFTTFWCV